MQEESGNVLTVQLRSGNCTSVLIIWIPAFTKMSSLLCSVPFVNTSFPICPCWDYGCYKLNSWHQHWQPRANLWNSAGKILTTCDTKECPCPSHAALCPSGASSAPFGQAAAGNGSCQLSQLQQASSTPSPPTSLEALCHSPLPVFLLLQLSWVLCPDCTILTPKLHAWNVVSWILLGANILLPPPCLKNCVKNPRLFPLKKLGLQVEKDYCASECLFFSAEQA